MIDVGTNNKKLLKDPLCKNLMNTGIFHVGFMILIVFSVKGLVVVVV
jgi:hypothetical protein